MDRINPSTEKYNFPIKILENINMSYDFELDCEVSGEDDYWELLCVPKPVSEKAIEEFGNEEVGRILLVRDKYTLEYLEKEYGINPSKTVVLEMIKRNTKKLQGYIGMNMLCSILSLLKGIEYIFLIALSDKLISLYSSYGFVSVSENEPEKMLGKISRINSVCTEKGGRIKLSEIRESL